MSIYFVIFIFLISLLYIIFMLTNNKNVEYQLSNKIIFVSSIPNQDYFISEKLPRDLAKVINLNKTEIISCVADIKFGNSIYDTLISLKNKYKIYSGMIVWGNRFIDGKDTVADINIYPIKLNVPDSLSNGFKYSNDFIFCPNIIELGIQDQSNIIVDFIAGIIESNNRKYVVSNNSFQNAIENSKITDSSFKAICYLNIGRNFIIIKQYKSAIKAYRNAVRMDSSYNYLYDNLLNIVSANKLIDSIPVFDSTYIYDTVTSKQPNEIILQDTALINDSSYVSLYYNAYMFLHKLSGLYSISHKNKIDLSILQINELINISGLWLNENDLINIDTLEVLNSLALLNVSDNQITCINPLKGLEKLCALTLDNNQITDISPLTNLVNLTTLSLNDNQIVEIESLQELKKLSRLALVRNKITDVSALKELKTLTNLSLSGNQIISINYLSKLENLSSLLIGGNQISDISPLKELKLLKSLALSRNQLSDINPLEKLNALIFLSLSNNQIDDIEPLQNMNILESLSLSKNKISDLAPLKKLIALNSLSITDNFIADISSLKNLTSITSLIISGNRIIDIGSIQNLKNLNTLWISRNKITNIFPLEDLVTLNSLLLGGNQIMDINPLKNLVCLTELHLNDNQIIDVNPLKDLKTLTKLYLGNNQITNITPLKGLLNLKYLNLQGNPLSTEQIDEIKKALPDTQIIF
jgi:internalin A